MPRRRRKPFGVGGIRFEHWLAARNIPVSTAAKRLKVSSDELTNVIVGRARPSVALRGDIEFLTDGYVSFNSWGKPTVAEPMPEELRPPKRREHCVDGPRPCPHLACRYHLYNDIKLKHMPDRLPDETCALDVADEGEHTLLELSYFLILTRERVRQIEEVAENKLRRRLKILGK